MRGARHSSHCAIELPLRVKDGHFGPEPNIRIIFTGKDANMRMQDIYAHQGVELPTGRYICFLAALEIEKSVGILRFHDSLFRF